MTFPDFRVEGLAFCHATTFRYMKRYYNFTLNIKSMSTVTDTIVTFERLQKGPESGKVIYHLKALDEYFDNYPDYINRLHHI